MKPLPNLFEIEAKVRRASRKAAPAATPPLVLLDGDVVIGLDLSLNSTGLAAVKGSTIWHHALATGSLRGMQRLQRVRDEVLDVCAGRALVVVEGLAFSKNGSMHAEIAGLWHVVVLTLIEQGLTVMGVTPTSLKKFITGGGHSKKDQIIFNVYKRWGVECATSDEADAVGLAKLGVMLGGLETGTVAQMECLGKVRRVV